MTPQCSKLINKYDRTRFIFYDANELDKEEMGHHLIEECRLALTEADGKQIRLVLASIEPLRWITLYEIPELDNTYLYILLRDPTWNEINPDLCPLGIELHFDTHGQRDWLTAKSLSLVTKPLGKIKLKTGKLKFPIFGPGRDVPLSRQASENGQSGPGNFSQREAIAVSFWNAILATSVTRHYRRGSLEIAKCEIDLLHDAP
ncbi:hypothetical protein T459_29313 [Capsicum annuum]|uniref:Uncharacterized protein n=1 Tax=Capsicum annuum TaxID=4072 RepID=A0A2G2Y583_CAPAN|nr:hypothetical protein T459_29313 [Capsicum annuum]